MKIFLCRAGEVETNEPIFLGWINFKLNNKGINSAKIVSNKIGMEKINFAFCSDQLRSKQALIEILKTRKYASVIVDHRLRERNYGIFTGHEKDLFKEYFPNKFKEIHRSYDANIPKGENINDVSKRVYSFMNDLLKFSHENNGNILICTHNIPMKLIRAYLEDLDKKEIELIENSPESLKKYELFVR